MLCSAGEGLAPEEESWGAAKAVKAAMMIRRRAVGLFIVFLSLVSCKNGRRSKPAATSHELLHRANAVGLSTATLLPRASVMAITAVIGRTYIGEGCCEPAALGIHAVAHRRAVLHRIHEDPNHRA